MVDFLGLREWEGSRSAELLIANERYEFDPYHFGRLEFVRWIPPGDLEVTLQATEFLDLYSGVRGSCDVRLVLRFLAVQMLRAEQDPGFQTPLSDEVDYQFSWMPRSDGLAEMAELTLGGIDFSFVCSAVSLTVVGDIPCTPSRRETDSG